MNNLRIIFLLIGLFFLGGCSHTDRNGLERRSLDQYYSDSGVTRYFLSPLPYWANTSNSAKCQREKTIYFMDFPQLHNSFLLSYKKSIHLQLQYNVEAQKKIDESEVAIKKNKNEIKFLPFQDREDLFFMISDRVQSDIYLLQIPKYKKINIIWIDEFLNKKKSIVIIKNLLESETGLSAPNFFVSLCLSYTELEQFVAQNALQGQGVGLIPAEALSPYDSDLHKQSFLSLNLSALFDDDQKLHLFLPKKNILPIEFQGKFKTHHY